MVVKVREYYREGLTADVHSTTGLVDDLGAGEPWKTDGLELCLVQGIVVVKNQELIVLGAVLYKPCARQSGITTIDEGIMLTQEEKLRQEGEVLRVEHVHRIHSAERDDADRAATFAKPKKVSIESET